jgi:hypothetical protein
MKTAGPLKTDAVESLRFEIQEMLPLLKYQNKEEAMRAAWVTDIPMNPALLDLIWSEERRTALMENDEAAWEAAQEVGMYCMLAFGRLPPVEEYLTYSPYLSSWTDLSRHKVVRAKDEYGSFPPLLPERVEWAGIGGEEEDVWAASVVDEYRNIVGPVFTHPTDPDAALWAAIQCLRCQ